MLVHVKEPPTEIRLIGRGAAEVLAGLKRLYPDGIVVDSDEEFVDLSETDWYRSRQTSMTPGKRLRLYRHNAGLTQARLSELTGIAKGNLSQMEHDKRPLGKIVAQRLARALKCDYRSLL